MPHRLARLTASLMLADVITFDFLRSLATRRLMSARTVSMSGKIFLTALMIRRQHGQGGYRTGPEGGGACRGARPEPRPGDGGRPRGRRARPPRAVEKALARRRERHSKSRGTARPPDAEGG